MAGSSRIRSSCSFLFLLDLLILWLKKPTTEQEEQGRTGDGKLSVGFVHLVPACSSCSVVKKNRTTEYRMFILFLLVLLALWLKKLTTEWEEQERTRAGKLSVGFVHLVPACSVVKKNRTTEREEQE